VSRNNLKDGSEFVRIAYDALRAGERLDNVPKAIVRIIDKDVWQDRICQVTKERVQYGDFATFVEDDPPEGLGTTLDTLALRCAEHPEAIDRLAQVTTPNDSIASTLQSRAETLQNAAERLLGEAAQ